MSEEFVEVPVTRRARVVLVGRLSILLIGTCSPVPGAPTLVDGDQFVLRSNLDAPFRAGTGRVHNARLDLTGIPAACDGDWLYRVEPA